MAWISVAHPPHKKNFYVKTLIPKDEGIKKEPCGRFLGHEDGALLNGISVLIRDPTEIPWCPDLGPPNLQNCEK